MIDFYFVDQMMGSDGSWWPSLVGALLGALISGVFAVIVSRGDFRRRREEDLDSKKVLTQSFVRLLESLHETIKSFPDDYSSLESKYREKPFEYNGYFIQSTRRMNRLLTYDQIELSIAFDQTTALNNSADQIASIFGHIDFLLDYAERMNRTIPDILKEWSETAKLFKTGIEELRQDTSNLVLSLRAMKELDGHRAKLLVDANNILVNYLNNPPDESELDLTYHYKMLPVAIINLYYPELFDEVPEIRDLGQKAKKLQWLYKDMESLIINELCEVLTIQLNDYETRINSLSTDLKGLSQKILID